jgi:hypothetical protein
MIKRPVVRSGRPLLAATTLAYAAVAMLAIVSAGADDAVTLSLEIKQYRFDPVELHAPPGKPITLRVRNAGSIASEIESSEMHFEKVIAAGTEATIRVSFFDDFHRQTQGVLIVP